MILPFPPPLHLSSLPPTLRPGFSCSSPLSFCPDSSVAGDCWALGLGRLPWSPRCGLERGIESPCSSKLLQSDSLLPPPLSSPGSLGSSSSLLQSTAYSSGDVPSSCRWRRDTIQLTFTRKDIFLMHLFSCETALKLTLTSVRDSWMSRVKWSCWASPSGSSSSVWTPLTSLACTLSNHKKGIPFLDAADGSGDLKINSPLSYNPIGQRRRLADGGPSCVVFITLQLCHQ